MASISSSSSSSYDLARFSNITLSSPVESSISWIWNIDPGEKEFYREQRLTDFIIVYEDSNAKRFEFQLSVPLISIKVSEFVLGILSEFYASNKVDSPIKPSRILLSIFLDSRSTIHYNRFESDINLDASSTTSISFSIDSISFVDRDSHLYGGPSFSGKIEEIFASNFKEVKETIQSADELLNSLLKREQMIIEFEPFSRITSKLDSFSKEAKGKIDPNTSYEITDGLAGEINMICTRLNFLSNSLTFFQEKLLSDEEIARYRDRIITITKLPNVLVDSIIMSYVSYSKTINVQVPSNCLT